MQHSVVDLENYARLYTEDRLREAARRQRANEVATGASWMGRAVARAHSWLTAALPERASHAPASPQPVQFVPVATRSQAASADPYAGMIVLVRGPKAPCTRDAA